MSEFKSRTKDPCRAVIERPVYEVIAETKAVLAEYDALLTKLEQQIEDMLPW